MRGGAMATAKINKMPLYNLLAYYRDCTEILSFRILSASTAHPVQEIRWNSVTRFTFSVDVDNYPTPAGVESLGATFHSFVFLLLAHDLFICIN